MRCRITQRGRYNKSNTSTIGSVCSVNNPAHNARKAYESSTSMLIYIPISFFLIIFNIYLNIKIFLSQLILTKKTY
jgi:hypothetical protein